MDKLYFSGVWLISFLFVCFLVMSQFISMFSNGKMIHLYDTLPFIISKFRVQKFLDRFFFFYSFMTN